VVVVVPLIVRNGRCTLNLYAYLCMSSYAFFTVMGGNETGYWCPISPHCPGDARAEMLPGAAAYKYEELCVQKYPVVVPLTVRKSAQICTHVCVVVCTHFLL